MNPNLLNLIKTGLAGCLCFVITPTALGDDLLSARVGKLMPDLPNLKMKWRFASSEGDATEVEFLHSNGKYYHKTYDYLPAESGRLIRVSSFDGTSFYNFFDDTLQVTSDLSRQKCGLSFQTKFFHNPIFAQLNLSCSTRPDVFALPYISGSDLLASHVAPYFKGLVSEDNRHEYLVFEDGPLRRKLQWDKNLQCIVGGVMELVTDKKAGEKILICEWLLEEWVRLKDLLPQANTGDLQFPCKVKTTYFDSKTRKVRKTETVSVIRDSIQAISGTVDDGEFRVPSTYATRILDFDLGQELFKP